VHEPRNQNWLDDHSSYLRQVGMSIEIKTGWMIIHLTSDK